MKTIINIKVDKDVKEQVFEVANDMGIPLSTLTNAFFKKLIKERSMTFTAPLRPSKKLEQILKKADRDVNNGRNLSPVFTDADSVMKYLNN